MDWTGFSGKTLWDWLQLLIIPFALAGAALWFNWLQGRTERALSIAQSGIEREIAQDQQRENMLQEYLNRMSELLLDKKLRTSKPDDEIRKIARVRTLATLRSLDGTRKGMLVQFLYDAGLIVKGSSIIELDDASLNGAYLLGAKLKGSRFTYVSFFNAELKYCHLELADLTWTIFEEAKLAEAYLTGADLSYADLTKSDLTHAFLNQAILTEAKLTGSNLAKAYLNEANLTGADLEGANLSGAFLPEANLTRAKLTGADLSESNLKGVVVNEKQLAKAKSLKGATMPDGTKHE